MGWNFILKQSILRQVFYVDKKGNCAVIEIYLQPSFLSQPLLEKREHRLLKRPTYNPTLTQSILHIKLEIQS